MVVPVKPVTKQHTHLLRTFKNNKKRKTPYRYRCALHTTSTTSSFRSATTNDKRQTTNDTITQQTNNKTQTTKHHTHSICRAFVLFRTYMSIPKWHSFYLFSIGGPWNILEISSNQQWQYWAAEIVGIFNIGVYIQCVKKSTTTTSTKWSNKCTKWSNNNQTTHGCKGYCWPGLPGTESSLCETIKGENKNWKWYVLCISTSCIILNMHWICIICNIVEYIIIYSMYINWYTRIYKLIYTYLYIEYI